MIALLVIKRKTLRKSACTSTENARTKRSCSVQIKRRHTWLRRGTAHQKVSPSAQDQQGNAGALKVSARLKASSSCADPIGRIFNISLQYLREWSPAPQRTIRAFPFSFRNTLKQPYNSSPHMYHSRVLHTILLLIPAGFYRYTLCYLAPSDEYQGGAWSFHVSSCSMALTVFVHSMLHAKVESEGSRRTRP